MYGMGGDHIYTGVGGKKKKDLIDPMNPISPTWHADNTEGTDRLATKGGIRKPALCRSMSDPDIRRETGGLTG